MIPLTTCPNQEDLLQSLAGRLPVERNNAVAEHLETCDRCQETIANSSSRDTLVEALQNNDTRIHLSLDDQQRIQRIIARIQNAPGLIRNPNYDTLISDAGTSGAPAEPLGEVGTPTEPIYQFLDPPRAAGELGGLGKYRILKMLGMGGMGLVFEALDPDLNRRVALKVMKPEWALDQQAYKRYVREAQLAASIEHDHIITIYEVSSEHAVPYLAMQLLKGQCLQDRLDCERSLPVEECLRIGREIAQGLAAAHALNLIHRDIKPANIWLEEGTGRVKILDFGLAKPTTDDVQLTSAGALIGTPSYMSPEQANGQPADARADLFSLGVVLYRMTTGSLPFPGKTTLEILKSLIMVTPPAPRSVNPAVSRELSDLIEELLAKDRDARPAGAAEVAQRLARIETERVRPTGTASASSGDAGRSHSMRWLVAAVASIALLAVIILKIRTKDGKETEIAVNVPGEVVSATAEIRDGKKTTQPKKASQRAPGEVATVPTTVREGDGAKPISKTAADANPKKSITLAALDPEKIPESERFDWQPEELVAVIGTHRLRDWGAITRVAFHPSGDFFISIGASTHVWSTQTLQRITGGGDPGCPESIGNSSLGFAPDGKSFYSMHGKYAVDLSNPAHPKFQLLGKFAPHKIGGHALAVISPDGRWLVRAGSPGGFFEVWDITGDVPRFVKEVVYPTQTHSDFLSSSKDGRRLVLHADGPAYSSKQVILLWDVDWNAPDGPTLTRFGGPILGRYAALSPDGQKLLNTNIETGASQSQLLDLSVSPPRLEAEFKDGLMQFSPDGNGLASHFGDVIQLRQKTATGWVERAHIPNPSMQNGQYWFSPDGKTLVVAEASVGVMRVWDLTANPPVERVPTRHYRSIAFSPDGRLLATQGGEANAVWKLDGAMPELVAELGTAIYDFSPPSFSPDSKLVAFSFYTGVWDLSLPIPQNIYQARTYDENFKKFATQGQSVLDLGDDARMFSRPWTITNRGQFRLGSRAEIAKFPNSVHQSHWLHGLRPAGGRFIYHQAGGKLQVWSLQDTTKPLFEVQHPNHTDIVEFALSDDGDLLAAFTTGGKNLVWDLSETPPREYVLPHGRAYYYSNPFFTTDSKLLIVTRTGGIDIHDWAAGRLLRTIPFPGPVGGLARHPDGQHIATVNGNGTVYILRLPELAEHSNVK